MVKFIGSTIRRLTLKELDLIKVKMPSRDAKWVTEGEFSWDHKGEMITVPEGYLTDGSSGGPDFGYSWLIHDYLYNTHTVCDRPITRMEADQIMIDILEWERAGIYARIVAWLVKWNPFGKFQQAWEGSGRLGPAFIYDFYDDAMGEETEINLEVEYSGSSSTDSSSC